MGVLKSSNEQSHWKEEKWYFDWGEEMKKYKYKITDEYLNFEA